MTKHRAMEGPHCIADLSSKISHLSFLFVSDAAFPSLSPRPHSPRPTASHYPGWGVTVGTLRGGRSYLGAPLECSSVEPRELMC